MDAIKLDEYENNRYTIEDIYALPDGQRAELIDGKIYYMAPPSRMHQRIMLSLTRKIADYIESKNGECEVNIAPFAVFLNKDDTNYVESDISVVCDSSKLDDNGCHGAPDWIIEVVSPTSRPMDYYRKLMKYGIAGVREYWVADHEKNHIIVYNFEHDTVDEYSFSEKVKAGIYEDLEIDFSEISTN